MNTNDVVNLMYRISDVIEENKLYLTELDASIGDGDHGLNLSKGFLAVKQKLESAKFIYVSEVLNTVAMTLISSVGGASGPLYGTAFMKGAMAVKNKEQVGIDDYLNILKVALEGIKFRGKATEGEKTMIDCLSPAIDSLVHDIDNNIEVSDMLEHMVSKAFEGVEYTKGIIATKGRASYLGERSIGHIDAGAMSCYLILKTISEEVTGK